jgi:hypothetical protein
LARQRSGASVGLEEGRSRRASVSKSVGLEEGRSRRGSVSKRVGLEEDQVSWSVGLVEDQVSWKASPPRTSAPRDSALRVVAELLTNYVLGDTRADVLREAIGDRHEHLVDALVLDESREEGTRLTAVVVAEKLPHLLDAEIADEVDVGMLQ